MSDDSQAILVHVSGRVQGVGFRAWTRDQAARLGVTGWVRNEPDGSVSALVSGRRGAVEAMIERLRQGPSEARVSDLAIEPADSGDLSEFRILR